MFQNLVPRLENVIKLRTLKKFIISSLKITFKTKITLLVIMREMCF